MTKKFEVNHSGFKFGWKPITVKPTVMSDGFFAMREWQEKAFDLLKFIDHMILNAPMGSGKSWMMCLLSSFKMKANESLRCIISVPQTIIASGFAEANMLMPDGEKLHWLAQHDLCNEQPNEGTVDYVISWLKGPYGFFGDRVLLCTHATLVAAYKKLKKTNCLDLMNNLLLWVDEAHHLKNAPVDGFDNTVVSNGVGELVAYAMSQPAIQIGLATASFFRGDGLSLLTQTMEEKFTRFNLPYDEYLSSMEHLRSFSFDFLLCGPDYAKAIGTLVKHRTGKDVIYIPHPKSRHSTGDKYQEVESIVAKYKKAHGGKIVDTNNGLTLLRRKGNDFKIIDLVDENRRAEKKEYIAGIKDQKDSLDAIIALGMFKEGANWIWADRSIIVGARTSLVDIIQMIGRLFRDAKGKKHVEVIQLLPFSLDQQNEDDFKENLNNYLKAIYASLILENILHPIQIKIKSKDNSKDEGIGGKPEDWLSMMLPDDAKQLSLVEDVSNKLVELVSTIGEDVMLWDEYIKALPGILNEYGIKDHVNEIGKQIWGMFARRTLRMQGIDVDEIDFNILQNTSPLESLLRYTSGSCGISTFKDLRVAISSVVHENKRLLLEIARNGESRPSCGTSLGCKLSNYTCKTAGTYDPVFDAEIRELRPDWFVSRSVQKKERLFEIAHNGEPRPQEGHNLCKALRHYTTIKHSTSYDPVFDAEIRELRPDWFVPQSALVNQKKERLFEIARNGEPRLQKGHDLYNILRHYTNTRNTSYDPVFDAEIRELRPDWFVPQSALVNQKKERLFEIARNGEPRPKGDRDLIRYTNNNNRSYDPLFDKEIRSLAPLWFIDTAAEKKQRLLAMARNGEIKPQRGKNPLSLNLHSYICRASGSYDPVFHATIKKIRPDWFLKCI